MEVREQRRQERADARAGRRSGGEEGPAERLEQALSDGIGGVDVKRAMTTAVAAALVGGLAGLAKAFADRHGRSSGAQEPERPSQSQAQADDHDEEDEQEESRDDETSAVHDEADHQHARDDEPDEPEPEQEEHEAQDEQPAPTGAASGDVAKMIARAREHVEQVLGSEPESVSGIERANGNWFVNVEIVKMHRVPDTTDVLASYAGVVDDDGDLVSLQERRRYRRSQSEEDR